MFWHLPSAATSEACRSPSHPKAKSGTASGARSRPSIYTKSRSLALGRRMRGRSYKRARGPQLRNVFRICPPLSPSPADTSKAYDMGMLARILGMEDRAKGAHGPLSSERRSASSWDLMRGGIDVTSSPVGSHLAENLSAVF